MFDISSIIHRVIGDGLNPAFHSLKHRILDDAEIFDWSIGSVILICYLLDPEQDIFRRIYHRCDTENISFELNDFLNEHYEFGDQSLKEFYIPGEI